MTRRENILAASHRKPTRRLPFFHYWRHCQIGYAERECRNRGMGIAWARPPYIEKMHGVDIREDYSSRNGETVIRRTYTTPVGSLYLEEKREPGVGQWHAQRSWRDVTPWQTTRLIKTKEDYRALKYIVENTEYLPDYFPIEQAMEWLGEDGVVVDSLPHSPMQMLMVDWIGSEGGLFFYHFMDYPELVDELYRAISESREPLYEIAADSPAPIAMWGDNVDGFLVTPDVFKRYFIPEYVKLADKLHPKGKLLSVHMDGRLNSLKHLITNAPVDIVEAFHPPPMGDLPLGEALSLWKQKAIWVGFPGSVYTHGPDHTREYTVELLKKVDTGERLVFEMSTENLVSNENLLALMSVLEKVDLPLDDEKIANIAKLALGS